MTSRAAKTNIYSGDSARMTIKGYVPSAENVPYGTNTKGIYYDGYPQLVKQEGSKPIYKVKKEKSEKVAPHFVLLTSHYSLIASSIFISAALKVNSISAFSAIRLAWVDLGRGSSSFCKR